MSFLTSAEGKLALLQGGWWDITEHRRLQVRPQLPSSLLLMPPLCPYRTGFHVPMSFRRLLLLLAYATSCVLLLYGPCRSSSSPGFKISKPLHSPARGTPFTLRLQRPLFDYGQSYSRSMVGRTNHKNVTVVQSCTTLLQLLAYLGWLLLEAPLHAHPHYSFPVLVRPLVAISSA